MDLSNLECSDDALLGCGFDPVLPPPLLVPAPVMDISFHPKLPILAVGLVTGEIAIYEHHGSEMVQRHLHNDFASWIFGRNKIYDEAKVVVDESNYCIRMHPSGGVTSMEFTDDGSYLVSASSDRTVSVLDCVTARLVIHLPADTNKEMTRNKKLNLRNRKNPIGALADKKGSKKHHAVTYNPHHYGISSLNVCDENFVATGDDDGLIALWDMRKRKPAHVYHEHGDFVSQLLYFTDVQELVSSSGDTCIGVYDVRGGRIRDFSERRKDEINCFAFINSSGANRATFIPSLICGTPTGSLPIWKYGSWRRPYDALESHPPECESIISFDNEGATFNSNIILTGACDGLVRVMQMYPLRRNLCQLSARDYTYSHASNIGSISAATNYSHNSNFIIKKQRGQEGIARMRLSHNNQILAVSGCDNVIDFVDISFLHDDKKVDQLRGKTERRHMNTLRLMEVDAAAEERKQYALGDEDREEEEDGGNAQDGSSLHFSGPTGSDASTIVSPQRNGEDSRKKKRRLQPNDEPLPPVAEGQPPKAFVNKLLARKSGSSNGSVSEGVSFDAFSDADCNTRSHGQSVKRVMQPKATRVTKHGSTDRVASSMAADDAEEAYDAMEELRLSRQQKRERAAAVKWLKEEKKKKINFMFQKRRQRVGGFFSNMIDRNE